MSDKPVAMLVTALAVAPICAVCILGPAGVGAIFGGTWAWLIGLEPLTVASAAAIAAIVAYGLMRRRKERTARTSENARS